MRVTAAVLTTIRNTFVTTALKDSAAAIQSITAVRALRCVLFVVCCSLLFPRFMPLRCRCSRLWRRRPLSVSHCANWLLAPSAPTLKFCIPTQRAK